MRLRNIPRADSTLQAHALVVKNPATKKGCWGQVFGNDHPVHIEIGMGKGRFLLNMAKTYPDVNFIGIERYSSVLLRAVERMDAEEYNELKNIRFVCMDARELENVFAPEEGQVEFKTDNTPLFDFSLEQAEAAGWKILAHTYDLHHDEDMNRGNIMTEYEEKFSSKGNPINKMIITEDS